MMTWRQLYGSVRGVGQELAVAGAPGLMLSGTGRHHRHGNRFLLLFGQSRVAGAASIIEVDLESRSGTCCKEKERDHA